MSAIELASRPVRCVEKQGSEVLFRQEDDRTIMLARHDMYVMNSFSREVVDLCDGTRSIADIADLMVSKHGGQRELAQAEVLRFIEFLAHRALVRVET